MDIQDTRPIEVELHPVCNQRYLIPTFSIGETYALVLKAIRRRDSGLVIWGHTRYGKTWAMLYCQQCLVQDFPDFPVVIYNAKREVSATKGNFSNSLLEVVGHKQWNDNVSISNKHHRLVNFMEQAALKDSRQVFILFMDEAQRLQQQHFDWIKDIYNDLRLKGVILLPILVGQQQLLDQKKHSSGPVWKVKPSSIDSCFTSILSAAYVRKKILRPALVFLTAPPIRPTPPGRSPNSLCRKPMPMGFG
ncbi:ATP-binding protein [Pseudomonas sp. TH34]|uniref:ATP-binding protein n=1 Tax=Pseudomonas sp. TH34 TaxID=2796399 RepID=UPI001F5B0BDE|nr:ATP-binding protein [Pseudomonas sp. TH34]